MEIDGKLAWEEYNRCQFKLLARHLEWEDRSKKKKSSTGKGLSQGKIICLQTVGCRSLLFSYIFFLSFISLFCKKYSTGLRC